LNRAVQREENVRQLIFHQIHPTAPRLVPGRTDRVWMDETGNRFAYRCLPLVIANSMGWEALCPAGLEAEWNGGNSLKDIVVEVDDPQWAEGRLACSHFGHGVLTFNLQYVVRTDPGIGIWVRGAPNWLKDGIAPLEGVVETDWLPFTFTMNWMFTRPGRVSFRKDEPFCFLTPIEYRSLEEYRPEIVMLDESPELQQHYEAWSEQRQAFNRQLAAGDPDAARQGWQKYYVKGTAPTPVAVSASHTSKLTLATPQRRQKTDGTDGNPLCK
jgi:hypothetical protein